MDYSYKSDSKDDDYNIEASPRYVIYCGGASDNCQYCLDRIFCEEYNEN